jgi:nucleoside-diphosphate-sugar epimerase
MNLITGATGFLGTHLMIGLLFEGKPVKAIKRKDSNIGFVEKVFRFYKKESLFSQINWIEGDLMDAHFVNEAVNNCDLVFNCAAQVSFAARDAKKMIRNNVQITSNVVNACLQNNVKKICHVSSIAALGSDLVISESTPRDKKENYSAYSKSKYESDLEVMRGTAEGLQTIIVYPSVLLGPWEKESGMFPLIENLQKGMKYFPKGASAFIDVRDVADMMIKLSFSEIENDTFILSAENLNYEQLFHKISTILKVKSPEKVVSEKMMKIASRLNDIKYFFSHKSNPLSKELIEISNKKIVVSANKINAAISHEYLSVENSVTTMMRFSEYLSNTTS